MLEEFLKKLFSEVEINTSCVEFKLFCVNFESNYRAVEGWKEGRLPWKIFEKADPFRP